MGQFSELFGAVGEAKVTKSGNWFKEGSFKVKLLAVKAILSQEDQSPLFIVETKVLESSNDEIKIGSERSQVIDLTNVMGKPNMKSFIAAVSGVDPVAEDAAAKVCQFWSKKLGMDLTFAQICDICVDEKTNPLEGTIMDLECVMIRTKPKQGRPEGGEFTKHNWQPRDTSKD